MGVLVEIDTKEICLLCYAPCVKGDDGEVIKRASSLTGLKQLLRYLKVNTQQLFNCSPGFLQWMEIKHEIDVQITLCNNCSLVTEEFDKLWIEYELIQFHFDKCLASLHQSMKRGADNPELVREFKKLMQPNKSFDLINASIAANLRDQTFKKCSLKLGNTFPRVTVQKIKPGGTDSHIIKQTAVNNKPNDRDFNSCDNKAVSTTVPKPPLFHNENDQDTQEWQLPPLYNLPDQQLEVPEVDPLEPDITDSFLGDEDETTDDIQLIHFSTPNSSASLLQIASSSEQPVTNTTNQFGHSGRTCDICNKIFLSRETLRLHRYIVHPEHIVFKHYSSTSKLTLAKCNKLAAKFYKHAVAKSSQIGNKINCCYCDKALSISKASYLKVHLLSQHMEKVVDIAPNLIPLTPVKVRKVDEAKCDKCSKVFASKAQLNKHKVTQIQIHKCQYCSFKNYFPDRVRSHELCAHIVDAVTPHFAPIICPIKFSKRVEAFYNKLLKIGTKCLICSCQMSDRQSLRGHILRQHFNDFLKDLRDYLDQGQFSDDESESEEMEETPSEDLFCQFCSFTTKHSGAIRLHELELHTVDLVMQHLPPNTSHIKCTQGMEEYTNKIFKMGIKCSECGSMFQSNAYLQQHMLSHHFDELVQEVRKYLNRADVLLASQEITVPPVDIRIMEFEIDNVKLEVQVEAADIASQLNPSSVDDLD